MTENLYPLPNNWRWEKLENVAKWSSGGTPSRKIPEYYCGDIAWLKTGELNDGYILDTEEKISQDALKNSSAKIHPQNTVVIAMYGATIGKVGILKIEAATNQACACAVCNSNIYFKYLFYYALSQKENFIRKSRGGAQPNISQEIIKNFPIPVPPLAEQKRIAALLDSLFEKLDAAKSIVQKISDGYELRRAAILYRAFTGKLTENFRAENGLTFNDWQEKTLSDLLLPMETRRPTGETFRYIDIDSIDNRRQVVKAPKIIETAKAPSRASRAVDSDNVLFSMVRPYLKNIALIDDNLKDCIASTGFFVCRCNENILPKFLYNFLRSLDTINYLMQFMKGDNSPSIRQENFLGTPINLPSVDEQKEIVRILEKLLANEQRTKEIAENVLRQIDALKKNILTRAFRGEFFTNDPAEINITVISGFYDALRTSEEKI